MGWDSSSLLRLKSWSHCLWEDKVCLAGVLTYIVDKRKKEQTRQKQKQKQNNTTEQYITTKYNVCVYEGEQWQYIWAKVKRPSSFVLCKKCIYFNLSVLPFIPTLDVYVPCFSKGKPKGWQPQETRGDLENTEVAWLSTSTQWGSTNSCPGVWEAKNNVTQYN